MLSDNEIHELLGLVGYDTMALENARAIEAAVLAKLQAQSEPVANEMQLHIIRKWPEGFQERLQHVWLDVVSFIPNVKLWDLQRMLAEYGFTMKVYEGAAPVQQERIAELEAQNKALLDALKSAAEAMDNCFYAVADVALTDDLNDFGATIKQARAAIAAVEVER